jgi:hypothetical protein
MTTTPTAGAMNLEEFLSQIEDVPRHWDVLLTKSGSMQIVDPDGPTYIFVFDDGRPPLHRQDRRKAAAIERAVQRREELEVGRASQS